MPVGAERRGPTSPWGVGEDPQSVAHLVPLAREGQVVVLGDPALGQRTQIAGGPALGVVVHLGHLDAHPLTALQQHGRGVAGDREEGYARANGEQQIAAARPVVRQLRRGTIR